MATSMELPQVAMNGQADGAAAEVATVAVAEVTVVVVGHESAAE